MVQLAILLLLWLTGSVNSDADDHKQMSDISPLLLMPLPSDALYFNGSAHLTLNFSAAELGVDKLAGNEQEISLVFRTTEPNAMLYSYEDTKGAVAVFLDGGNLSVNAQDKTSNKHWRKLMPVVVGSKLSSFSSGVALQVDLVLRTRESIVWVFLGHQRLGGIAVGSGVRLFGSGVGQWGKYNAVISLHANISAFVGEIYYFEICQGVAKQDVVDVVLQGTAQGMEVEAIQVVSVENGVQRGSTEAELDSGVYSVTFFGGGLARVGVHKGDRQYWDLDLDSGNTSELAFELRTFDPIGVILFKGSQLGSYAYVCVEIYDGRLYLRYNLGVRGQDSSIALCGGALVNDGQPHDVSLRITALERETNSDQLVELRAVCNGVQDAVASSRYEEQFGGYLYIGGVDSVDRLSWHVWSRRDYNGAMGYFRINDVYVDFHDFFSRKLRQPGEHAVANRLELRDTCHPPRLRRGAVCRQSEGGRCWVDRESITHGRNFLCDCSTVPFDATSCAYDYYETYFGEGHEAISLQITPTWTTHCDDISISFRTNLSAAMAADDHGMHEKDNELMDTSNMTVNATTPTLFKITNERYDQHMLLRMVKGGLEFEILLCCHSDEALKIWLPVSDLEEYSWGWHTIKIQRRANFMQFFYDGRLLAQHTLQSDGFAMEVTRVHTGCVLDASGMCDADTIFTGEIRNFVVNRLDVLTVTYGIARTKQQVNVRLVSVYSAEELLLTVFQRRLKVVRRKRNNSINSESQHNSIEFIESAEIEAQSGDGEGDQNAVVNVDGQNSSFVSSEQSSWTSPIGLLGHRRSLLELPATHFVQDDDDVFLMHFIVVTNVSDSLVLYVRGHGPIDAQTSFITLELVRRRWRILAQISGKFINSKGITLKHTVRMYHNFDWVFAGNKPNVVMLTLRKDYLSVRVDEHRESFFFLSPTENSEEISLVRLPDQIAASIIYVGGMPPDVWTDALRFNHSTVNRRHLRGCLGQLTIRDRTLNYEDAVQLHGTMGVQWNLSPTCSLYRVDCSELPCEPHTECVQPPNADAHCSCAGSAFRGSQCDEVPHFGYYCGRSGVSAGVYLLPSFRKTTPANDSISVGILTTYTEGVLLHVENLEGEPTNLALRLKKGQLYLDYSSSRTRFNVSLPFPRNASVSHGFYTEIRLRRYGNGIGASVFSNLGYVHVPPVVLPGFELFKTGRFRINLCGELDYSIGEYFTGIVSGLTWNGIDMFEYGRSNSTRKRELRGDVVEVYQPYQLVPWPCYGIFSLEACVSAPLQMHAVSSVRTASAMTRPAGFGEELSVYVGQPLAEPVAASQSHMAASTVAALALISAILLVCVAFGSMFMASCANCAGTKFDVATLVEASELLCVPPTAANNGDIGLYSTDVYRSAAPVPAPTLVPHTLDVQTTACPSNSMMAMPMSLTLPLSVPVPVPVPYPVPVPVPYAFSLPMPVAVPFVTPILAVQQTAALQNWQLGAIGYAQRNRSALRIADLETSTSTSDTRVDAATDVRRPIMEMQFGGTETVQKTLLSTWQLEARQSLVDSSQPAAAAALVELGDDWKASCFVLTADCQHVVTGSAGGPPQCWSLQHGDAERTFENETDDNHIAGVQRLHLACNGSLLVAEARIHTAAPDVPPNYRRMHVWRMADGITAPTSCLLYCTASCLLNDTSLLLAGALDCGANVLNVCLWDLQRDQPAAQLVFTLDASPTAFELCSIKPSADDAFCVAALSIPGPDGEFSHTSLCPLNLNSVSVCPVQFITFDCHHECFVNVPGSRCVVGTRQGEIVLWSIPTARIIHRFTIQTGTNVHCGAVTCVTLSQDAILLATGDVAGNAKVWRFDDNAVLPRLLHSLDAHQDRVSHITFASDNEWMLTASLDGSIRLWKTADGVQVSWFTSNTSMLQVQLAHNKQAIVALGEKHERRKVFMLRVVRNVVSKRAT